MTLTQTPETEVLARLARWATGDDRVRALLLSSSRTNPQAPLDALSDYDIVVVVTDIAPFAHDDAWIRAFDRPVVQFRDDAEEYGIATRMRLVHYAGGTKIDYSVWPVAVLERIPHEARLPDNLDLGYRVLLDKDGLTAALPPPTYTAHIPTPPTEAEYRAVIEEFWWESNYVAKNLWRDELVQARYNLDYVMKFNCLVQMLEWRIELDHAWTLRPGNYGRYLKQRLDPQTWAEYAATFTGPEIEENWDALFRTTALMRRVATEVGAALGYAYPQDLGDEVTQHLQAIRRLEH